MSAGVHVGTRTEYNCSSVLVPTCTLQAADTYSQAQTEPSVSENKKEASSDAADWPVLSDKVRIELVSRAAGQIKSGFPIKRTGETTTSTENISMEKLQKAGSTILKKQTLFI